VKKLVLVLAAALTLSVFATSQSAWALTGDCNTLGQNSPFLLSTELYTADFLGNLFKIEISNGSNCEITFGGATMGFIMTDLALDQNNQILYGISQSPPQCYTIDRTTGAAAVIDDLHVVGAPAPLINDLNSFEIDSLGRAWVAGQLGNLYLMNLSNCELTPKIIGMFTATAPGTLVRASGDLIWDAVNNNRLFMSSFDCEGGLNGNCGGNNGIYIINTNTLVVTFFVDSEFDDVFAGDLVKNTGDICFVTRQGELFALDTTTGLNTVGSGFSFATGILAFGGAALDLVGGIGLDINETALFIAAAQSNLLWISPFMLAGLGIVAFILARKSSAKVKK